MATEFAARAGRLTGQGHVDDAVAGDRPVHDPELQAEQAVIVVRNPNFDASMFDGNVPVGNRTR
jgi:hypothetical protein